MTGLSPWPPNYFYAPKTILCKDPRIFIAFVHIRPPILLGFFTLLLIISLPLSLFHFFFHLWRLKIWLKRSVKCWIITSSLLLVLTMILLRFLRLIFSMPICCECNPLPIFSFPICFFCVYIVFWNWVWETWNKVIGFWVCTLSTVMVFLPYSIFTILRLNPTLQ